MDYKMSPIGHVESVFKTKNGTPRQSGLAKHGRAIIRINKNVLNNPQHSLENLEEFSHVWIIWIFHQNGGDAVKAKVAPPRLGGKRVGLFSTRTPHRPNPIGLTLARVERVIDDVIHLLGIDMVDGTPVLDIKPYIPLYDAPGTCQESSKNHHDQELFAIDKEFDEEAMSLKSDEQIENKIIKESDISDKNQNNDKKCQKHRYNCDICDFFKDSCDKSSKKDIDEHNKPSDNNYSGYLCDYDNERVSSQHLSTTDNTCSNSSSEMLIENIAEDNMDNLSDTKHGINETDVSTSLVKHDKENAVVPDWIGCVEDDLKVSFSNRSIKDLNSLNLQECRLIQSKEELVSVIRRVLASDPRSIYRKNRCSDRLYYTSVENIHVTAWFDPRQDMMEVLALQEEKLVLSK